jgi:hypothetical protein
MEAQDQQSLDFENTQFYETLIKPKIIRPKELVELGLDEGDRCAVMRAINKRNEGCNSTLDFSQEIQDKIKIWYLMKFVYLNKKSFLGGLGFCFDNYSQKGFQDFDDFFDDFVSNVVPKSISELSMSLSVIGINNIEEAYNKTKYLLRLRAFNCSRRILQKHITLSIDEVTDSGVPMLLDRVSLGLYTEEITIEDEETAEALSISRAEKAKVAIAESLCKLQEMSPDDMIKSLYGGFSDKSRVVVMDYVQNDAMGYFLEGKTPDMNDYTDKSETSISTISELLISIRVSVALYIMTDASKTRNEDYSNIFRNSNTIKRIFDGNNVLKASLINGIEKGELANLPMTKEQKRLINTIALEFLGEPKSELIPDHVRRPLNSFFRKYLLHIIETTPKTATVTNQDQLEVPKKSIGEDLIVGSLSMTSFDTRQFFGMLAKPNSLEELKQTLLFRCNQDPALFKKRIVYLGYIIKSFASDSRYRKVLEGIGIDCDMASSDSNLMQFLNFVERESQLELELLPVQGLNCNGFEVFVANLAYYRTEGRFANELELRGLLSRSDSISAKIQSSGLLQYLSIVDSSHPNLCKYIKCGDELFDYLKDTTNEKINRILALERLLHSRLYARNYYISILVDCLKNPSYKIQLTSIIMNSGADEEFLALVESNKFCTVIEQLQPGVIPKIKSAIHAKKTQLSMLRSRQKVLT